MPIRSPASPALPTRLRTAVRALLVGLPLLAALPSPAAAAEVGWWRSFTVPSGEGEAAPTTVALWYPTAAIRGPRIPSDARGPRITAIGHSAGGYTVLALAGGRPDPRRIPAHCAAHGAEDPLFCAQGRGPGAGQIASGSGDAPGAGSAAPADPLPDLADARVRAAVALAPVGAVFDEASLARIRVPVAVHVPALDRWLVPRFHGMRVAAAIPGAVLETVPNAWHFAFLDAPSMPIPSPDGDLRADPPGFDRAAYIAALGPRIADFLDAAMAGTASPSR
jgi:predicted dienelactone hydrolase